MEEPGIILTGDGDGAGDRDTWPMRATDPLSHSFTSFTGPRSPRYPAPDVARGFMLLLIALANVPFWHLWWEEPAQPSALGEAWVWVRGALVDQRSYPLFAMLFGFGLVVMAQRRIEHDVNSVLEANRASYDLLPAGQQADFLALVREAATVDARRMVRRRGWWMLVFGAAHSLFFGGDIIGAYGLIAVLLAGTFVRRRTVVMWGVGALVVVLSTAMMVVAAWMMVTNPSGGVAPASAGAPAMIEDARSSWYPLVSLGLWLMSTPMTVLTSMSVPAAFIGAWVAGTDLLTHPERHRRALVVGGVTGLAVGAVASVPFHALMGGAQLPLGLALVSSPLSTVIGGLAGACGWLALLAVLAGGARADGEPLTGMRRVLAAVGKRSMTAYLLQTVCFVLLYGTRAVLGTAAPGTVEMALTAVAVWLAIAAVCVWLERSGRRGPFERMLRAAVARTARRSKVSQLTLGWAGAPSVVAGALPDAPAQGSQAQQM